jgi:hypothetical protein
MQYVVVLLLEGRSSIRCSGVFNPAARISPVKGDPVKCPDAETVGVCSSEITALPFFSDPIRFTITARSLLLETGLCRRMRRSRTSTLRQG